MKVLSICTHFLEKYTSRSSIFSIFAVNEIFKYFFTKRDLIGYDIAILLVSILFIEIGFLRWWNFFFSILISLNFIIFSIFIYAFKNLYIFEIYISLYLNLRRNWFGPTGLLYEMLSTEMFSYNFLFNKMLLKPIFVH